jgi:cytochrome bd-type quinol oxidase subunit 2
MNILTLVSRVLREPASVVDDADHPKRFARLVSQLILIAAFGAALFGMVVGSYRGGIQIGFAALKMPILLAVPVVIALPAMKALWVSCGVDVGYRRLCAASAVGMARTAVLVGALGPVLWLLYSLHTPYHLSILFMVGALALAGIPGLYVMAVAVPEGGRRRPMAMLSTVLLMGCVFAQTGWMLRPFVVRPSADVAALRQMESDVFSAIGYAGLSSIGRYPGWQQPRATDPFRGSDECLYYRNGEVTCDE